VAPFCSIRAPQRSTVSSAVGEIARCDMRQVACVVRGSSICADMAHPLSAMAGHSVVECLSHLKTHITHVAGQPSMVYLVQKQGTFLAMCFYPLSHWERELEGPCHAKKGLWNMH